MKKKTLSMKNIPDHNWKRLLELKDENRIDNLLVEYYEYAGDHRDVRVIIEAGGVQVDAYAECSPKDMYVKPYGRNIAAGRLLKKLEKMVMTTQLG